MPEHGPHVTEDKVEFSLTMIKDYVCPWTKIEIKEGVQGCLCRERDSEDGQIGKVYIAGVTEHMECGTALDFLWVPSQYYKKGEPLQAPEGETSGPLQKSSEPAALEQCKNQEGESLDENGK